MSVSPLFHQAAKEYGASLEKSHKQHGKTREDVCVMVAVGFLNKMTKTQINEEGRKACGLTEEVWNSGKSEFSKAWSSLDDSPGKYGAGETLATMWAKRDFTVKLDRAYQLSRGPRKDVDKVASIVKQFASLSSEEQQEVIRQAVEIAETLAYAHNDIQALVKLNFQEAVSGKVENKLQAVA